MPSLEVTHDDILDAVADVIRGLDLPIIGSRVYVVRYPNEMQIDFPGVFVSIEGETEQPDERVNEATDWDYPTRVFFADQRTSNDRARIRQELAWRQQLIDAFHMKTPFLDTLPNVYRCKVVPNVIYNPQLPAYQHIVSGMVVWSKVRVERDSRVPVVVNWSDQFGAVLSQPGLIVAGSIPALAPI